MKNRKFTCPVSMRVTPEQGEELCVELAKLCYIVEHVSDWLLGNFIATKRANISDSATNIMGNGINDYNRHYIPEYNKELFLALAAMSEGEEYYEREIVISENNSDDVKEGNLCLFVKFENSANLWIWVNLKTKVEFVKNKRYFRKATKEEIIAHFTKTFVLPEKWCIKKDKIEIVDWFNNQQYRSSYFSLDSRNNHFIHYYDSPAKRAWLNDSVYDGFTEITFDQFKEHVLNQKNMKVTTEDSKKIIGYKCPMDLFEGKVKKGDSFTRFINSTSYTPEGFNGTYSIPKEIVETWEPVYETKEVKVTVTGRNKSVEVTIQAKGFFMVGGKNVSIIPICQMVESMERTELIKVSDWIITPQVSIGCVCDLQISELQKIINAHKQFISK